MQALHFLVGLFHHQQQAKPQPTRPTPNPIHQPIYNGMQPTPYAQAIQKARNSSAYLKSTFGPYNQSTIPLRQGDGVFGGPLPNNRFPLNVQKVPAIPLFNDGSPQGSSWQLQPQPPQRSSGNAWDVPIVPLLKPIPRYLI